MKIRISALFGLFILFISCTIDNFTENDLSDSFGYEVSGDKITFIYDPNDYPKQEDNIITLNLSGDFNDWDMSSDKWQTVKNEKGIWFYHTSKSEIKNGSKFKFIANQVNWQSPLTSGSRKNNLMPDGYGYYSIICKY
jgi:hypothetical protein